MVEILPRTRCTYFTLRCKILLPAGCAAADHWYGTPRRCSVDFVVPSVRQPLAVVTSTGCAIAAWESDAHGIDDDGAACGRSPAGRILAAERIVPTVAGATASADR